MWNILSSCARRYELLEEGSSVDTIQECLETMYVVFPAVLDKPEGVNFATFEGPISHNVEI